MADLVMLIGGTGDQSEGSLWPCVISKDLWEDSSVDASDFMGTNGSPKAATSGGSITYGTEGNTTISGDFSALSALLAIDSDGCYIAISDFAGGSNNTGKEGYFKVLGVTSTTSVTISNTNLAGDELSVESAEDVTAFFGSAGDSISTANTRMADIAMASYSVDVLYNISESLAVDTDIDSDSTDTGRIRFFGTQHVGNGDSTGEFIPCTNSGQFPVISTSGTLTTSGYNWFVEHIYVNHVAGKYDWCLFAEGLGSHYNECKFHVNIADSSRGCVYSDSSTFTNCLMSSNSSPATYSYATLVTAGRCSVMGCIIRSSGSIGAGIGVGNQSAFFYNNIVYGNAADSGVYVYGGSSTYGFNISSNIIVNFTDGIHFETIPDVADYSSSLVMNNIIWGSGTAGDVGIANDDAAKVPINILNNFIGNVTTETEFAGNETNTISLTANPFKNANEDYSEASDFWLNDTAGGGALIKNKMLPTDYDLDGTQDNFITGIIQEEITAGGGGRIMRERRHNV